jgi:hypothetical protein
MAIAESVGLAAPTNRTRGGYAARVAILDDVAQLAHLGLVLKLREATLEPVLAAASKLADAKLLVGASAHGRRLEVVMPYHPDALAVVAPDAAAPATATLMRIVVDGETMSVALATAGGNKQPRVAVDELAPAAQRDAWFDLVDQLCSIADARIVGLTRFVDGSRVAIEIQYPQRDRATDFVLMEGIEQLAGDIGVSGAQCKLWRRIHPELGAGNGISLSTSCTPARVSAHFGITYPVTSWEVALRLAEGLVLNDSEAKAVPTNLGQLAGALGSDRLQSLELVLGPHEPPDVIVWARVGRAG